jgi:hypothetical protein
MSARTTFGDDAKSSHSIQFTLHMAGRQTLKLETGEVFQNPAQADGSQPKHPPHRKQSALSQ